MNRREFVRNSVAAGVAAGVVPEVIAAAPKKKLNVLYVFSDQHRWCSVQGMPYCNVQSPNFDRFAKENFVMENCISSYPLCSPYRGVLISGRWPTQTGVDRLGHDIVLPPSEYGLGQAFKDNGYSTGYVGKWHLYHGENTPIPPGKNRFGFDYWRVWGNTNIHYRDYWWDDSGSRHPVPEWAPIPMTDQAIDFIKAQKQDKPWMLVLSWNPPHPPFNPPPEDQKPYPQASLPMRPNVSLVDSNGHRSPRPQLQSEAELRESEQGYFGGITGVDAQFQRLLDALDKAGMADNTVVVYSSDHGEMMGSKDRMAKQVPYEESCHVPFYVRVPGGKPGSSANLFGAIDIYPTLCGLGGIPVPKGKMGVDMSSVIRGEQDMPRDGIIFMNQDNGDHNDEMAPGHRSVRTPQYTYSVASDGRWLLFDNIKDPYQMHNLIDDPTLKPMMDKFDEKLFAWQKEVGDKFPLQELVHKKSSHPW